MPPVASIIKQGVSFDEATHRYSIGEQRILSVTQIIESVGLYSYNGVRQEVLDEAAERGVLVDELCGQYDAGDINLLDLEMFCPKICNRVTGWSQFRDDWGFNPIISQTPFVVE